MGELCPPHYDRPRLQTYKMCKYIVDVTENEIPPPEYLRNVDWSSERINFGVVLQSNQEAIKLLTTVEEDSEKLADIPSLRSFEINPLELSAWPSATDLGMDTPQYVAFRSAITQELAIIQGPPGACDSLVKMLAIKFIFCRNW